MQLCVLCFSKGKVLSLTLTERDPTLPVLYIQRASHGEEGFSWSGIRSITTRDATKKQSQLPGFDLTVGR